MKIWFALLITFSAFYSLAQDHLGPRLNALANNGVAIPDVWSVRGNPSAIAFLKSPVMASRYGRHFLNEEISTQALAGVLPFKNNAAGLAIQRYGFSAYQALDFSIVYAKNFGNQFSIGLRTNYHQIRISQYGVMNGFSVDAGFLYRFSQKINIGTYLMNISGQKFNSREWHTEIPVRWSFGGSYQASDKILLALSVNKERSQSTDLRVGLDYVVHNIINFRGGLSLQPFRQYAGIGINYKNFAWDLSNTFDPQIGYSPQIAVAYVF